MTTVKEALLEASVKLKAAGVETPSLDAEVLLSHSLGLGREELLLLFDKPLKPKEKNAFTRAIARREKREPVALITGIKEFWSLTFRVSQDTLVPRPESETLVEAVLRHARQLKKKNLRILDYGTGTGCLLLALLSEMPKATGVGVDITKAAIDCAKHNAQRLGLSDRAEFALFDWEGFFPHSFGFFDILVSNPPYIPGDEVKDLEPEVSNFDPRVALDGGHEGLVHFRKIIDKATMPPFNSKEGLMAFEVGISQSEKVSKLLKKKGFQNIKIYKDLAGINRVVTGIFRRS